MYLFHYIRSKIVACVPYPFQRLLRRLKNFHQLCIRSTASVQKFSSVVFPFDCIRGKIFFIRASVRPICFKRLGYPFLICVLARRFLILCMETQCRFPFKAHKNGRRKPTQTSVYELSYLCVNSSLEELIKVKAK